jgi:hypothetical protein
MFPLLTVERRSRPRDWRAATLKAKPVVDAVPLQAEMLNAADRALARHHTKEHVHCTARCWQRSALLCEGTTTAPPHASKRCPDRTDLQRRICCRANENRPVRWMQLEHDSGRDDGEVCEFGAGYVLRPRAATTTGRGETDHRGEQARDPNEDRPLQCADRRCRRAPRSARQLSGAEARLLKARGTLRPSPRSSVDRAAVS